MQLENLQNVSVRKKLARAALTLVLLDAPTLAHADSNLATPSTQLDISNLFYGEEGRTQIFEPMVRATRLFPDGQSLSAQFGLDVITGASPSGAIPSAGAQTITTASGQIVHSSPGAIPVTKFGDQRFGFDGDWHKPLSRFTASNIGGHFSRERDYQSLGINGKLSVDLFQRLTTLTLGGGYNHDSVFPHGGSPNGLSDGTIVSTQGNPKQVNTLVLGIAQVLSRRWLLGVDLSRTFETGYLTEPYKVISIVDPITGLPIGQLTDKRPTSHDRTSILFDSVYHLTKDIVYASYRYYTDSWDVQSNTYDFKYRHELGKNYLEPHFRYYKQTAANFYVVDLLQNAPLPDFATADNRLGPLKTITLGAIYGFHLGDRLGEWRVRVEYIRQTGESHPQGVFGVEQQFDLSPPINTIAAVAAYSFGF